MSEMHEMAPQQGRPIGTHAADTIQRQCDTLFPLQGCVIECCNSSFKEGRCSVHTHA